MDFFNSAVTTMSTLVTALGGGLGGSRSEYRTQTAELGQPCGKKPGRQAAHGGRRRYAAGPESRASALWSDRSLSGTGKRLCKA